MAAALTSGLTCAGVMLFFAFLRSSANRPAQRNSDTGELVLQPSSVLVWSMGISAVGGPVGISVLMFIFPFKNEREAFALFVSGAFFLFLGGLMTFWAIRRRTRISTQGLTSEYMLARPQFLAWEDVTKVSLPNDGEFWLHGTGQPKALFHLVLFTGVKEAMPLLLKHLPEAVRREDRETLDRIIEITSSTVS